MINLALVQLTKKHTEIFGVFIELIVVKFKWNLTIYYNLEDDKYTFVNYYQDLFNTNIEVVPTSDFKHRKDDHDFYIFTSSADKLEDSLLNNDFLSKCIFVNHQAPHWKEYMYKNIIVSPLIHSPQLDATTVQYILPIYKNYAKLHSSFTKNNIAIIGAIRLNLKDKDVKLLIDLINKKDMNFKVFIFMRKRDWYNISRRFPILKEHSKIKVFSGLTTEDMINKLQNVKFILPLAKKGGWFHWQRLTGTIPLALNLNIPLILDNKLASIYGIKNCGICYENSILEVIDKAEKITKKRYYKLIENIVNYKKDIYKQNKVNFLKLFLDKKSEEKN